MPEVTVVYWRDIPAQVIVGKGRRASKMPMTERFELAIDRCAMRAGARDSDAYLAEWRKGEPYLVEGEAADVASGEAARLESEFSPEAIKALIANDGWATPETLTPPEPRMAKILDFVRRPTAPAATPAAAVSTLAEDFSIEVMPRTAAKVADFRDHLPAGTRVYLAHIDGTDTADMLAAARRLVDEGFTVMPHVPARGIASAAELDSRLAAYADAGVREALVIAGGIDRPRGPYHEALQLLRSGRFDARGFTRLHIAGHPEGNRDIDPDGGETACLAALRAKAAFARETDAEMAIATQFVFEAAPVIAWADRLAAAGVHLPLHIGVAGPARLQTLLKFAMSCGVGPSIRVLQRRAADLTRLMLPFTPDAILADLAAHKAAHPDSAIAGVHFFPLGGIPATTDYAGALTPRPRRARA